MKINKFVNDVFNNEYVSKKITDEQKEYNKKHDIKTNAQKLEEFVNKFKAYRDSNTKFELVNGDKISYWYNHDRYSTSTGTMGNSCMRYNQCKDYLRFYDKNIDNVSLLILKDPVNDTKIIGRAIVWKLTKPTDRIFMDRIYTEIDSDVELFKEYAKNNGWLYKNRQNMNESEYIFDTLTNEKSYIDLVVTNMVSTDEYPYMDTLKFYNNNEEVLTNNRSLVDEYITLTETDGSYEGYSRYSNDELIDMYVDDILSDFEEYAKNYFPQLVWDYVNDENFIDDIIDSEADYYTQDFIEIVDHDYVIKYINKNVDDEKLTSLLNKIDEDNNNLSINDLDDEQLLSIVDDLDIKYDIAREFAEDRYSNYSAKDYCYEIYGVTATTNLSSDVYDTIEGYINITGCAREYADNEDIDYIRERYT